MLWSVIASNMVEDGSRRQASVCMTSSPLMQVEGPYLQVMQPVLTFGLLLLRRFVLSLGIIKALT